MAPTTAETACFEAGIKFGALYHQFAGTPVSAESAGSLETAIEDAIENQPYCRSASVEIDRDAVAAASTHGYTELTGRFMTVELRIAHEGCDVRAEMAMEAGYPRMSLVAVENSE